MKCPRCPDSVLEEREGVTVDGCRSCYGIWLDRGELERLVARAREEIDEIERRDRAIRPAELSHDLRREERSAPPYGARRERWDDDDDDDRRHGRYPRKRKRWFETLGDIFD